MAAAWHGAAFGRSKTMPALAAVLGEAPQKTEQTPEQMIAAMQSLMGREG